MDLEAMDILNRQESLRLDVPTTASVVGCGGTGFWVAVALAMSGCERLLLFDPDRVESSNLNRLLLVPSSIGETKVYALNTLLKAIRPNIQIQLFNMALDPSTLDLLEGTVFCCTDNIKSQQEIYTFCKLKSIPYQRVGYDGTTLNVSRSYPLVLEEEPPRDGYEVTPSWVVPACVAGMLGVASQCYSEITLMDDLNTICHRGTSALPKATLEKYIIRYLKAYRDIPATVHNAMVDAGYGYCGDCERGDCSDCDRGICSDCDCGYCPDCDREDRGSYDRGYDEGYSEGYDEGEKTAYDNIEAAISDLICGDNNRLINLNLPSEIEEALLKWRKAYERQQQQTQEVE